MPCIRGISLFTIASYFFIIESLGEIVVVFISPSGLLDIHVLVPLFLAYLQAYFDPSNVPQHTHYTESSV